MMQKMAETDINEKLTEALNFEGNLFEPAFNFLDVIRGFHLNHTLCLKATNKVVSMKTMKV